MANSDKNIVITPNNDAADNVLPEIRMAAGDATSGPLNFRINAAPGNSGTVQINSDNGEMWTIKNNIEGKAFSVSTPSGYEVIAAEQTGRVVFCETHGRLNIPGKPAFQVENTTSTSAFAADAVATWNQVSYNNYGGFNNGDRFTAPHQGIYYFSCMMLSNASARLFHRFRINGSDVFGTWTESAALSNYQTNTTTMTVPLNKNDFVQVYLRINPGYGNVYSNFNGFQIA
jgi:hypothetical protein